MQKKVLVTGATGATGSNAINRLLELGVPIRAMVHTTDERSDALTKKGIEVVIGELSNFNSVSKALEGIYSAYFVYSTRVPGLIEATAYFAQAAKESKVQAIVNMSQRTARRETKSHAAQNHWIAERVLDWSGISVTHLQPTLFAEWALYFPDEVKVNHRLISPFGNALYASITSEDIGNVIASILANPKPYAGSTYPLFGPQQLRQSDVAAIISQVLGKEITFLPMEIQEFAEILSTKYDPYFVQHISAVAQDFRDGILEGTNNLVEEISGIKPTTMKDFIQKNADILR